MFLQTIERAGSIRPSISFLLFIVAGGLTPIVLGAQVSPVEQATWRPFVTWAKEFLSPTDDFSPDAVLSRFRSHLNKNGVPAADISRQIDALAKVLEHSHTGPLPQQQEWDLLLTDKYYSRRPPGHIYPFPPNAFLASVTRDLPPGAALDCGMGSGRDSIYLAQKGWSATGFDRSGGAVALALENAQKAGVKIEALTLSAADFDWGKERFDLISNIHSLGFEESLQEIRTALKTGGIYVVSC